MTDQETTMPNVFDYPIPPESKLSYERSLAVALATGAEAHWCYANAWNALQEIPFLRDAALVEGFLVLEQPTCLSVIEHGWCAGADARIIDPSLVLLVGPTHPVWYFPAIWHNQAARQALSCDDLPSGRAYGTPSNEGWRHPDYQRAYQAAFTWAKRRAQAANPHKKLVVEWSIAPFAMSPHRSLIARIVSSSAFLKGELQ